MRNVNSYKNDIRITFFKIRLYASNINWSELILSAIDGSSNMFKLSDYKIICNSNKQISAVYNTFIEEILGFKNIQRIFINFTKLNIDLCIVINDETYDLIDLIKISNKYEA